jgi:L-2-hydroxyglutarate oxidase
MIARAREFLPSIRASKFTKRGTAGIRSSVIDRMGKFVPDTLVMWEENDAHVLNYNSPGATGALPMAAKIASRILELGQIRESEKPKSLWDAKSIAEQMKG